MSSGTVKLTNNNAAVTGTGTTFKSVLAVGDFMVVTAGGVAYTLGIKSVESDTQLTLVRTFGGPTTDGLAWQIIPRNVMVSITAQTHADVSQAMRGLLLDKQNWQSVLEADGDISVTLPDGTTYSGPSWPKIAALANASDISKIQPIAEQVKQDAAQVAADKKTASDSATAATKGASDAAASAKAAGTSADASASSADHSHQEAQAAVDSATAAKASETNAGKSADRAEAAAAGVESPVSWKAQSLTADQQQQVVNNLSLDKRYLPAFPVSVQGTAQSYTKIATIKMTTSTAANATLLLSGANNFGESVNQTDMVSLSFRGETPAIRHLILSDAGAAANRATWGYVLSADKKSADFWLVRPAYSGAFSLSTLSASNQVTLHNDASTTTSKPDGLVAATPVLAWSDKHKPAASDVDAVSASKGGEFSGTVTVSPVIRAKKAYSGSGAAGDLAGSGALQVMIEGRGGNGTPEGAIANTYMEEVIGTEHRYVLYMDGFGRVAVWMFKSGGQTSSPLGELQVSGSDVRLKRDFTPVDSGYRKRIESIGVVEFSYRDDKSTDKRKRGFLAQQMGDIDDIYTFFAGRNTDDDGEEFDILNVNHTAVTADLVATVQDLLVEVDGLKQQVAVLMNGS